ncbi:hypothetical protein [Methanobrevibacter sp.]|uniref:hypothetical protein n=1 Tax=Methanobrevibacter sp. TaxID=66852 RepID=UPI0038655814
MKIKYLMIVGLILAILTIGAVSASEISDDLAVDDDRDIQQAPLDEDDELGDSVDVGDFYVRYEESIAVNSNDDVISVSNSEEPVKGNLTVNVGNSAKPVYNAEFDEFDYLYLYDLGIEEVGSYKILVNFVPTSGNAVKLLDYTLNVTGEEGYEGLDVEINDIYIPLPLYDYNDAFVEIENYDGVEGNILVYIDNELYYNKTLSTYEVQIQLSDLNKRPSLTKHFVEVKFDDGDKTTLVKSRTVSARYSIDIDYYGDLGIGIPFDLEIYVPKDATGDLYVIFNGKEMKVSYKDGVGNCTLATDSLELNKTYRISAELRNDAYYPKKEFFEELTAYPSIVTPYYYMALGETQWVSINLPSSYSGTLKLYKAKLIGDPEDQNYVKDGSAIASVNLVDGKAEIPISGLSKGEHDFIYEYENGKYVYSDDFYVLVKDNTDGISATVSPTDIEVGNSVAVQITGPKNLTRSFEVYVDGRYNGRVKLSNANTMSVVLTTPGKHYIKVLYDYEDWEDYHWDKDVFYSNTFVVTVNAKPSAPVSPPAPKTQVTKLTLKKVKVKNSAKKLTLSATLKINGKPAKGKVLTFKFNKKTLKAKTNKKGVAKVKIKGKLLQKLKVGKKVTYQVKYGKTVKKLTAKVQK